MKDLEITVTKHYPVVHESHSNNQWFTMPRNFPNTIFIGSEEGKFLKALENLPPNKSPRAKNDDGEDLGKIPRDIIVLSAVEISHEFLHLLLYELEGYSACHALDKVSHNSPTFFWNNTGFD